MKIFGAPCRYIQGNGVLDQMGDIIAPLGKRIFVFTDEVVLAIVGQQVETTLQKLNYRYTIEKFGGECCESEILRLRITTNTSVVTIRDTLSSAIR